MNWNVIIRAASAATLIGGQAAAGGLQATVTEPEPVAPISTSTDWSGLYGGVFVGAGAYGGTAQDLGGDALDAEGIQSRLHDLSGEAGVALGYNVQRGSLVYGAEIDFAGIDFSTDEIYDDDYRQEAATSDLLTLRGRIGLAVDDTLIYTTAGFGRASISACASDDEDSCIPDDDEIAVFDDALNGLVFGAGVEHMLTKNVSFKAEFLQFVSETTDVSYDSGNDDDIAVFSADQQVVRLGVNYHF